MATPAQTLANIRNARKSTGPRTVEGKQRTRLNAVKHGYTAQVVILPEDQLAAYESFKQYFLADLAPQGALEEQLALTAVDAQWRMNRLRAQDAALLSLGQEQQASRVDTGDPQIDAAFASALTLRAEIDTLSRMSLYEQRLSRLFDNALKRLHQVQGERKARQAEALREAAYTKIHCSEKNLPFRPAEFGFVFSEAEIDRFILRRDAAEHGSRRRSAGWARSLSL